MILRRVMNIGNDNWRWGVSLDILDKQLNYLSKKYVFITMDDIEAYLKGKKNINKPSVLICLDDGYKDILLGKALFKKYNIKPVVFLLSNTKSANRKELDNYRSFLSNKEILELYNEGWILGCHSATHSNFYTLTNKQIENEIVKSKHDLEKELGIEINYFAYPKGRYTNKILDAVKKAQYKLAFTMDDAFVNKETNKLIIPRIGVDRTHSLFEFKCVYLPSSVRFRKFIKENIGVFV